MQNNVIILETNVPFIPFCNHLCMQYRCVGKTLHETFFDGISSSDSKWASSVFARECVQHYKLKHPNIVQCVGVHFLEGSDLPMLVMEKMHMSLRRCLETYHDVASPVKHRILYDVSLGLQYLHSHSPPIVHRDLTANNVLLTQDMTAKLADFGVSRIIDASRITTMTQVPGAQIYMPPEALCSSPKYDEQLDVFSFGVLIIHIVVQEFPTPECGSTKVDNVNRSRLIAISEVERRANFWKKMESECSLQDLSKRCLCNDPAQRPHVTSIVSELETLVSSFESSNTSLFSNLIEASQLLSECRGKNDLLLSKSQELKAQLHAIHQRVKTESQWSEQAVSDLSMQLETALKLSTLMADNALTASEDYSDNRFVISYRYPSSSAASDLVIKSVLNSDTHTSGNLSLLLRPPINMTFSGTLVKKLATDVKKPWGIAVSNSSEKVFVVDQNGYDSVISYDSEGKGNVLLKSAGILESNPHELSCWYPTGITTVGEDVIFVVDSGNKRVLKLSVLPGGGVSLLATSSAIEVRGTESLVGIGVARDDSVFVCDRENHQLVIFDNDLKSIGTFGSKGDSPVQFNHPWDVAFDSQWNMYVADCSNGCLKVFTPDLKPLRSIGSPGSSVANLRAPAGICIDANDYIYIADKNLRLVFVFDPAGNFRMRCGEWGSSILSKPMGLAISGDGLLYVTNAEHVVGVKVFR